jgi:hypothetical protein
MLRKGLLAACLAPLAIAAPASAATLTGTVKAAGQPVAGTTVSLFSAGATAATPLASGTTDGSGAYSLTYTLPADSGALYAVAAGGPNAAKTMRLAASAPATQVPDQLPLTEQTTVATAYSFAQFFDGQGAIHGSFPGLPNAALTATSLIEPSTAKIAFPFSGAPNGNTTEALPLFNTVAALLQRCSATGEDSRTCAAVLKTATPAGGTRPTDTLQLALRLAQDPNLHPKALYGLAAPTAYKLQLTEAPSSWILAVTFTGMGLNAPGRMAFDTAGNAWIGNNFQGFGTTAGLELTATDPTGGQSLPGAPYVGGGLYGVGWGTAVDHQGRIWLGNYAGNSVSLFTPDGKPVAGSPFTQGGIAKPQGLAIGADDSAWFANFANSSVTIYPQGDPTRAQQITGGGLDRPFGLQLDGNGVAWVTNQSLEKPQNSGSVIRINPDGSFLGSPITGGGLRSPMSLSFDSAGNAWVANLFSDAVTQITPQGVATAHRSPAVKGGWSTAIDGDDHVWVADFFPIGVSELCGIHTETCPPGAKTGDSISPSKHGYQSKSVQHITAVQIDPSGNVWLANNWSNASPVPTEFVGGNGIVKLIGAAAPVKTPLFGLPQRP